LLNTLSKSYQSPVATPVAQPTKKTVATPQSPAQNPSSPRKFMKGVRRSEVSGADDGMTLTIDAKEEAIQRRIAFQRRKLLWPGIWTLFALAGTYGTFAYLDVKSGIPSSDGSHLPERAKLPQTWYLTPTVVLEGVKAGWNELDNLTIGIVVATFAIHLLRKSPLPIWENLIHITGEKKYTAFTYTFVNASWAHAATNMAALVWFLPGVVRYFDGDLFHTAAFLTGVPLITSYLSHFAYRFGISTGLVLNLGASGAIAAAFGAYCVVYADEKMWAPQLLVLRIDAMYWGALYAAAQAYKAFQTPKGGNRPAYLVGSPRSTFMETLLTLNRFI
jgi:membrane associated rhomboid family serine protease